MLHPLNLDMQLTVMLQCINIAILIPLVNRWDLGADPLEFAKQRQAIVAGLWDEIADKVTQDGMGYQRVRRAFRSLLGQYSRGMFLATRFIGGQYHHRDHKGDENGRLPYVPVPAEKQREALKFIKEHALSDKHSIFHRSC